MRRANQSPEERLDEPLLAAWLRPLVYLVAAGALAYPLTTPSLALAVCAGAALGAVLGRPIARSRLRLSALTLLSLAAITLLLSARTLALGSPYLAHALGPGDALALSGIATFGPLAACVAVWLRVAALRVRPLRALEVGAVTVAFAGLVVSHRDGAINRPFELADSIIAAGGDPTFALLAIGAVAALLVVILLLGERRPWRVALHVVIAFTLLMVVVGSTRVLGLPKPPPGTSGLGLRPEEGQGKEEQQSGQGQGGRTDNEELQFRDDYASQGRQVPLAVVLLHDDYSPPSGLYYFRQTAFSQFNGQRLVSASQQGIDEDVAQQFVLEPTKLPDTVEAPDERVKLDTTVALLAEHRRPFALESPLELRPQPNPDPGRFRRVYRATSAALVAELGDLLGREVGNPAWSNATRQHYYDVPDDARYHELAEELVGTMPFELQADPVARAAWVAKWLGEQGIYSLKSQHAGAEDPTADFLFGDKTGYCVHFAHAAVYLMRALGVPARIGAGYAFEEASRQGGSTILLTGANSHAWPEVYIDEVGWVVMDVSPERSLDEPMPPPDPDLQRLLGEMARGLDPIAPSEDTPFEPAIRFARELPAVLARLSGTLALALLLLAYAVKLWRRTAPMFAGPQASARVAYRAELDRLSEVALRREFGESREGFARRLRDRLPSFEALTRANVARAFGDNAQLSPSEARALGRASRQELSRTTPWYRRVVGWLNPFAWLYAR